MSIVPRSVLITGCNRGIGLELVKQFLAHKTPPSVLIATCRNLEKADDLTSIAKDNPSLHVLSLDVNNTDSFSDFAQKVSDLVGVDHGLNLLINNAGVLPANKTLESVTP